jgi:hypothetical protein
LNNKDLLDGVWVTERSTCGEPSYNVENRNVRDKPVDRPFACSSDLGRPQISNPGMHSTPVNPIGTDLSPIGASVDRLGDDRAPAGAAASPVAVNSTGAKAGVVDGPCTGPGGNRSLGISDRLSRLRPADSSMLVLPPNEVKTKARQPAGLATLQRCRKVRLGDIDNT